MLKNACRKSIWQSCNKNKISKWYLKLANYEIRNYKFIIFWCLWCPSVLQKSICLKFCMTLFEIFCSTPDFANLREKIIISVFLTSKKDPIFWWFIFRLYWGSSSCLLRQCERLFFWIFRFCKRRNFFFKWEFNPE